MSGRKVCLNCPTSYYTGKEQSPLHFGLSAEGYEINSIMEGFDKDLWIVEVRNNKKVWTKKENINKMTYEIPVINETNNASQHSQHSLPVIPEPSPPTEQPSQDNDTDATDNATSAASATTASATTTTASATTASATTTDTSKSKEKVSKTIKPTDYTLFITYRIHQMKGVSGDNKKNYDTAREEWKEYKKKPDELRVIMVEANNYHSKATIVNKK
jgi:hypothetical protein